MNEEKDNFHVDMSGRIYRDKTIGIALVGTETKINYGCAIKGNLLKLIKKRLFKKNIFEDSAKLYAICISLLVKEVKGNIKTLIICNDEDFEIVKKVLNYLLKNCDFEIINISEFRKRLGRNIGSFADNYANIYRRKALKPNKWTKGKELNVVEITYKIIKQYWEEIKIK
jgi:hypothetical protein